MTGWVTVEANDEEEAAEKAVTEENFVKDIKPDLENIMRWEFCDDYDSIEEVEKEDA